MASDDEPLGYMQSDDGTWYVVGPDGHPVEMQVMPDSIAAAVLTKLFGKAIRQWAGPDAAQ